MTPTTPIEIEGELYDRYTASLALMVRHTPSGQKTSVNVNLAPTRIDPETGNPVVRHDHARSLLTGDATTASEDVQATVAAILAAGQAFIDGRGL